MSTLAVVEEILRETAVPMSVREIVERAGAALPTKSKTPDTVVARDLSMDIKRKGERSLFIRTSPGRYTLREIHLAKLVEGRASSEGTLPAGDGERIEVPEAMEGARVTPVLESAMSEERAGARPSEERRKRTEEGEESSSIPA